MATAVLDKNISKQQLLNDLRDSLIGLDEKRKASAHLDNARLSSWRDLFMDENN